MIDEEEFLHVKVNESLCELLGINLEDNFIFSVDIHIDPMTFPTITLCSSPTDKAAREMLKRVPEENKYKLVPKED